MGVFGISEESDEFLINLDERKLLDLIYDLLALDRHSQIKITDGPGDGQRDIHSVDKNGNKLLIQSKYHSDLSHSASSTELGQIIQGMGRLGYKKGLFITNAKISAPAKRDCLNAFPEYSIDFIDGLELVKRVLDNLILKAIWYDGISINKVNYILRIPAVARDLEKDKPFSIIDSLEGHKIIARIGHSDVQLRYQKNLMNTTVFGQYRSPKVKTVSEFDSFRIHLTEIIVEGTIHLADIEDILSWIGIKIIEFCKIEYPLKKHFVILLGTPSLSPLGGEISGDRLPLDNIDRISMVFHENIVEREEEWLIPSETEGWLLPRNPPTSQLSEVCWYNQKSDLCFRVSIISPPSEETKWQIEMRNTYFTHWWNQSLFMLVPEDLTLVWKEKTGLVEPSKWYCWYEGKHLGVWCHPNLISRFWELPIRPENDDDEPFHLFGDPDQIGQSYTYSKKK